MRLLLGVTLMVLVIVRHTEAAQW